MIVGRSWTGLGMIFCLLLVLLAPAARGQERTGEVDLRPKFERGQTIRYKLEQGFTSINDIGATRATKPGPKDRPDPKKARGQDGEDARTSRGRVEMALKMKVSDISAEGVATVETTIESLKMSNTTPDMEVEFDSAKPPEEDDIVGMMLKPLVGTTLTLKVDRAGNVTSVSGGEAFSMLGQAASGSGGGGGASQLFGPIFSSHPTTGFAKVGQSWEHEDKLGVSLLGDFKMITRHTLRGLQGRDAVVAISGRIEPATESPPEGGFQVKNSTYNGSYTWDTAKGQLAKMDTSMSVRLEGKAGDQPMSTRNEATVKITRVPDRP
jgi:hypothetical protein